MRVALAGLHSECASTSPLEQTRADFTRTTGAALVDLVQDAFDGSGVTLCPVVVERSLPGGPLPREVFDAQCDDILAGLAAAMPLDGALLLMHGALFVPGLDDPEGHLITRVRALLGPEAILSASFDLHGNVTQTVADHLDAFAAYHTAPHIDVPQTRARAARMLLRALGGGPRPRVLRVPVPVVVSGEMSATTVSPCRELYAALPSYVSDGVWDTNLMIGYVWADSPRAAATAIVTCTDIDAGASAARAIARSYWDARDGLTYGMPSFAPPEALSRALSQLPATLADSGDNPTAGGVGDRAEMLALLHARADLPETLIAGICAPRACAALAEGAGQLTLGNDLGGGGPEVTLTVEEAERFDTDWVIRSGPLTIALTQQRRPFHTVEDFARLGLRPDQAPLLVVKSGYLSPMLAELPRAEVMALTDGAVSQDFDALPNAHRQRPSWPFQTDFQWEPPCAS